MKANVNATQIRGLFDAVAQDRAGRDLGVFDEDLQDMQLETWSKQIRTSRRLWQAMLPSLAGPGKKSG